MAKRARELSLQKAPEPGVPTTPASCQGAMKARMSISLSEATEHQRRETQAARARSGMGRVWKMVRRISAQDKASKLEFIGDSTVLVVVEETKQWSISSLSSSPPPGHPISNRRMEIYCVEAK